MSKNLVISLLLCVAILLSWLLLRNSSVNETVKISQPDKPDYFMNNVNYTRYSLTGAVQTQLFSPHVVHYPLQDSAQLTEPRFISHTKNNFTWDISADQGTTTSGLNQVFLKNNVVLKRLEKNNTVDMTIITSALTAYPKQGLAKTTQPVTIIQPGNTVHAVGMTANLNTGEINLLSRAQGVYQGTSP